MTPATVLPVAVTSRPPAHSRAYTPAALPNLLLVTGDTTGRDVGNSRAGSRRPSRAAGVTLIAPPPQALATPA
ncbi:hypothetical protein [Gordonia insulae]|uniref:hypothetical protein n=1 Tax=Gordonia insulae TaxID=2420509 RepID=UPI000F5C1872|nr:hypothetical protein [Gordonia insulae]